MVTRIFVQNDLLCICICIVVSIHEGTALMSLFRNSGSGAHYQRKTTAEEESWGRMAQKLSVLFFLVLNITFTCMHLADAFIQSDLQCIQTIQFFYQYVCSLGFEPTTFCAANTMLYSPWATEIQRKKEIKYQNNECNLNVVCVQILSFIIVL